jgi:hypothetical protein
MRKVFVRLDLAYISGMVWKDNCSGDGCHKIHHEYMISCMSF